RWGYEFQSAPLTAAPEWLVTDFSKRKWARSCCRRNRAQSSTRDRCGGDIAGQRGELPAGARNVLRREVDLLCEPHQLPIAGTVAKDVAGLPGKAQHRLIGAQRVAEQ